MNEAVVVLVAALIGLGLAVIEIIREEAKGLLAWAVAATAAAAAFLAGLKI